MEKVNPVKVIVFAIDPGADDPKALLDRLAGLVKFILNRKGGKTSLSELAAKTAQGETAVRLGLEWLSKQGQLTVELQRDGDIALIAGGTADLDGAAVAAVQLENVLEESRAYRKLFQEQTKLNLG
jgi:DNA-binding transcriptional regulator PaaX